MSGLHCGARWRDWPGCHFGETYYFTSRVNLLWVPFSFCVCWVFKIVCSYGAVWSGLFATRCLSVGSICWLLEKYLPLGYSGQGCLPPGVFGWLGLWAARKYLPLGYSGLGYFPLGVFRFDRFVGCSKVFIARVQCSRLGDCHISMLLPMFGSSGWGLNFGF